jgi:MSHA pilin protein MshD
MFTTKRLPSQGFTLIEMIIFIVIVGIGVAGILSVYSTNIRSSADPIIRKQALAIAESLLEEILLKEFKDPDGGTNGVSTCNLGTGTNRSLWKDVCSYNTYISTGINDMQGNSIAALSGYNITSVAVTSPTISGIAFKQVVVTVTDTQSNTISLTGYRGDY